MAFQNFFLGTVSHGTLRPEDLIEAFGAALDHMDPENYRALSTSISPIDWELVIEYIEALDALAPEGFYFGAHEGDGSDFGFWPHS